MRKIHNVLSSALIIILLLSLIHVSSFAAKDPIEAEYTKGRIIVQFDSSLSEKDKDNIKEALEISTIKKLRIDGLEVIKYNSNQAIEDVLAKVNSKKGVILAEPDYILRTVAIDPSEYGTLWGLSQSSDIDIDAPEAWNLGVGSNNVIVAVIDTGVQIDHPDLVGRFVSGYDFYNNDSTVYDGLDDDHGTHVSGTILANSNGFGIIGVAGENTNIQIMPLKFLGANGGSTSDAIEAIDYARIHGAKIISASWGGGGYSELLKAAIERFGGPFIAAAGNSKINTDLKAFYPAGYNSSNIISVAAVDSSGRLASFSNYGATSVDVGAPGVSIRSTVPYSTYAYYSGTSMAAPHVSGVAALLLSQNKDLSTQQVIDLVNNTGMPLSSLAGKTVTGKMVNAYSALSSIITQPPVVEPPVEPPVGIAVISSIPLEGTKNVKLNSSIILTTNLNISNFVPDKIHLMQDGTSIAVSLTLSIDGQKLTLTPNSLLTKLSGYTLILDQGALNTADDPDGSVRFELHFSTGRK